MSTTEKSEQTKAVSGLCIQHQRAHGYPKGQHFFWVTWGMASHQWSLVEDPDRFVALECCIPQSLLLRISGYQQWVPNSEPFPTAKERQLREETGSMLFNGNIRDNNVCSWLHSGRFVSAFWMSFLVSLNLSSFTWKNKIGTWSSCSRE